MQWAHCMLHRLVVSTQIVSTVSFGNLDVICETLQSRQNAGVYEGSWNFGTRTPRKYSRFAVRQNEAVFCRKKTHQRMLVGSCDFYKVVSGYEGFYSLSVSGFSVGGTCTTTGVPSEAILPPIMPARRALMSMPIPAEMPSVTCVVPLMIS